MFLAETINFPVLNINIEAPDFIFTLTAGYVSGLYRMFSMNGFDRISLANDFSLMCCCTWKHPLIITILSDWSWTTYSVYFVYSRLSAHCDVSSRSRSFMYLLIHSMTKSLVIWKSYHDDKPVTCTFPLVKSLMDFLEKSLNINEIWL